MVDMFGNAGQNYDFVIKHYFNTGHALAPKCLVVLPLEPKRRLQKCKCLSDFGLKIVINFYLFVLVAIGAGKTIQYWEYKKGEPVKTFESEPLTQDINTVVISGQSDKASVFMAAGQCFRGLTR